MQSITGYTLKVTRGARAGLVKHYGPASASRRLARRFADKLDLEYGAICCSLSPVFEAPKGWDVAETAHGEG